MINIDIPIYTKENGENIMRYILSSVGIVLFILFFIPTLFNVINFANILGMIFSLLLALYGIFFRQTNIFIKAFRSEFYGKVILCVVAFFAIAAIIYTVVVSALMISAANNKPEKDTTVVVLGCKINPVGPSVTLLSRLEAAYEFLYANENICCVLSGGQGEDEHISEALAMRNWLVDRGIDEKRLFVEDKSTSTKENLLFSKEIIEKNGLCPKITIITNEFHQYRAGLIAKNIGMEAYSISAKTPFYLFPTYYVRELFGVLYEILR